MTAMLAILRVQLVCRSLNQVTEVPLQPRRLRCPPSNRLCMQAWNIHTDWCHFPNPEPACNFRQNPEPAWHTSIPETPTNATGGHRHGEHPMIDPKFAQCIDVYYVEGSECAKRVKHVTSTASVLILRTTLTLVLPQPSPPPLQPPTAWTVFEV